MILFVKIIITAVLLVGWLSFLVMGLALSAAVDCYSDNKSSMSITIVLGLIFVGAPIFGLWYFL